MLTRFAPSPTGYLHIGNIRTALLCYLYAKSNGGKFMLRIDDTDEVRSEDKYIDAIRYDLDWLDINPDVEAQQSKRFDRYDLAVERLKNDGRLYACYESQQELDMKRKMQLNRGLPPIYDRESLNLTEVKKQQYAGEGRKAHWRFKINQDEIITWDDKIRGKQRFEMKHMSDPILIRENGLYTYMLPSTVDDIELGITHVIRGEDHISNTALQIEIFNALGGDIPTFAHNSFIKSKEGKLSKSLGSQSIGDLRALGIKPIVLASFLAKIGTSDSIDLLDSMEQIIAEFDINKFGKSPTNYTLEEIERLNVKLLHNMDYTNAKAQLSSDIDETFWLAVRPNIEHISEVQTWWNICNNEIDNSALNADDKQFLTESAQLLSTLNWDDEIFTNWISLVKQNTDRKGKNLFMPIRIALTGLDNGPELKNILPLIGKDKAMERLNVTVAK